MKKIAVTVIPHFASFLLSAQNQTTQSTETKTTTTTSTNTWNGTLIDAACQTTHSEHKESSSSSANREEGTTTTRTESSHSEVTECPVTTTTTSFALMTADGKLVRFDQPSNTKIVEVVKSNKEWNKNISEHHPLKVTVVGQPSGDVVVLREIK
jgi:hypothetical protein